MYSVVGGFISILFMEFLESERAFFSTCIWFLPSLPPPPKRAIIKEIRSRDRI